MHKQIYKQLDQKERDKIYRLKEKGWLNSDIAKSLGRNKSTIGRELRRNSHQKFKRYLPDTAERKAERRKVAGRKAVYVVKDRVLKKKIICFFLKKGGGGVVGGGGEKKKKKKK